MNNELRQPAFCQTDVNGSASSNYLIEAANIILEASPKPTYYTPKKVVDLINLQIIISNPPYDTNKG